MKKILLGLVFLLSATCAGLAQQVETVGVEVLAKTTESWDGNTLPTYATGQPEVTILKITIPPKMKLEVHRHPIINAGVLLKGKLTVVTENEEILHMKAGDAIVEVVNKWHYGKNESDEPAEILVFYAGIKGEPVTVKK
ncbi:Cupin 2 conserved barrel domain protein [Chloroherpeton thalassium ATCC 35110]|uniref:Cupin 2 conserved barrel domain protein n=1 Tax=Chloroherpeton thalassium (strain ATCC 35110 / GB-78) TaxID=517418 RepID=B3QZ45_CHLT3|nr:cupin domain-containing protein [Chloroherpeton thalassium]ACF13738.1 Cupin 2 conserved barrel domain protein [Chloroherpeton thalassium ATCC 35110]